MHRRCFQIIRFTGVCFALLCNHCVSRTEDPVTEFSPALMLAQVQQVLIIGDSLTDFSDGFHLQEYLGPGYIVQHTGVINTDFNYWTGRLDEAFARSTFAPPAHVIVPLGTNDAFQLGPQAFVEHVHVFHAELRLRSAARIYYFLMPVTLIPTLEPSLRTNNAALSGNVPLDNTVLVDLMTEFDRAPPAPLLYDAADPLHPTETGYRLIGARMRDALLR